MSKQKYERKGIVQIDQVLPLIRPTVVGEPRPKAVILDELVNVHSLRLLTFKQSLKCASCGIEGSFFALERAGSGWHLNLYAKSDQGEDVLMTHDHIMPLSKGGKNEFENTQTMCYRCNELKSDSVQIS